ncbi:MULTISPECIES: hypothetical protein [Parabacteroides]|jgi:hypothetical protein|uniref:Uncharacterized protein n=1 Tax=Siphoviridae sp. ct7aK2 TaxID=2825351 RepID=A0A8S5U9D0_9CAUD|nr:hypothetical protein [Parabacteroides goldsteinii]DAF91069.1 MAG TPA: hypothetical protein [Siphoviridae sp. ct7aK2]
MNVKYFHEFKGLDEVSNRFEILCNPSTTPKLIEATNEPFRVEYLEVKKLEPVQGSQATLKLISESNFQFLDLHTDDMQGYMIKFYRAGELYWIGYLDSELYNENLTDYAPYPVEFSGADFNIWERLKFRDENEKTYNDIASFLTQLKRCFNKLGLPFQKLYIGCSTIPEGVAMNTTETALHALYIQSANFYDEDKEPMSCREVVESILQPLGLMMVQRDASVYIYDLNTIKSGGVMKCYNFDTLSYIGDTAVNVLLGDIGEIGTMSTDASLSFEEMINNVTITCSLYGQADVVDVSVKEANLSDLKSESESNVLIKRFYSKCTDWNAPEYVFYKSKETNSTLLGAKLTYSGGTEKNNFVFQNVNAYMASQRNDIYLCLKCNAYVNTKNNPLDSNEKVNAPESSRRMIIYCKVLLTFNGQDLMYYNGVQWKNIQQGKDPEYTTLVFLNSGNWKDSRILNTWLTNSNVYWPGMTIPNTIIDREKDFQAGRKIPLPPKSGCIKVIIDYAKIDENSDLPNIFKDVKDLLIDKVSLTFEDADGKGISTDDYEFNSYINKKVKADYEEVTLKCISANEDKLPVGKANILRKVDDHYEYQTAYTRAGQTNILERLLMCTIHSNFTTKNKAISIDIKMTDNPALRYVTYKNVLQSDGMYITGATLDFSGAKTTIKAVEFSADVDKLSDIPYE